MVLVPAFVVAALEKPAAQAAQPSDFALTDIPAGLLPVYRNAARETCNMPWEALAAVGSVESNHGRSRMPGVHSGTNAAGAAGPMQVMPATWRAYGVDGDDPPDGVVKSTIPRMRSGVRRAFSVPTAPATAPK